MFCIKDRFLVAASAIGTPTETFERHHLVGAFGLYVLYRRLTPPNILPDAKVCHGHSRHLLFCMILRPMPSLCFSAVLPPTVGSAEEMSARDPRRPSGLVPFGLSSSTRALCDKEARPSRRALVSARVRQEAR